MNSSPAEKQKTTLGELSEAAAYSKNNSACSFAQISCSLFFFFASHFLSLSAFPWLIKEKIGVFFFHVFAFYFKTAEI